MTDFCKKCGTPRFEMLETGGFSNEWYYIDVCPKCKLGIDEIEAFQRGYYESMIIDEWLCRECGDRVKVDGKDVNRLNEIVCDSCAKEGV